MLYTRELHSVKATKASTLAAIATAVALSQPRRERGERIAGRAKCVAPEIRYYGTKAYNNQLRSREGLRAEVPESNRPFHCRTQPYSDIGFISLARARHVGIAANSVNHVAMSVRTVFAGSLKSSRDACLFLSCACRTSRAASTSVRFLFYGVPHLSTHRCMRPHFIGTQEHRAQSCNRCNLICKLCRRAAATVHFLPPGLHVGGHRGAQAFRMFKSALETAVSGCRGMHTLELGRAPGLRISSVRHHEALLMSPLPQDGAALEPGRGHHWQAHGPRL